MLYNYLFWELTLKIVHTIDELGFPRALLALWRFKMRTDRLGPCDIWFALQLHNHSSNFLTLTTCIISLSLSILYLHGAYHFPCFEYCMYVWPFVCTISVTTHNERLSLSSGKIYNFTNGAWESLINVSLTLANPR